MVPVHLSPAWRQALMALATVVSLVMLGLSTYWAMRLGRAAWSPSSCSGCHAMRTEAANWALGPHGKVACVQCHGRVDLARFTFASVTGSYRQPVAAAGAVSSQACLECHKLERQISPTHDLTIPHSFHVSLNMDCVDCHAHLVHGPPGGNLNAAPADFGQRVPMARCRTCHNGSMAPRDCATCHADALGKKPAGPQTETPPR